MTLFVTDWLDDEELEPVCVCDDVADALAVGENDAVLLCDGVLDELAVADPLFV